MPPRIKRLFRFPWRTKAAIADEVEAELRFHMGMRASELEAGGMSPADARREAEREFGDVEFTKRYCRALDERGERSVRMSERLAEARQNITYAARTLGRAPGFAAVSLLTLALAIGANTAIFSVASAVLLQPPPYARPSELVAVYENNMPGHSPTNELSAADFFDYRAAQHSLTGLAAYAFNQYTLADAKSDPVMVLGLRVSANMFDVLGVGALRGRTFAADEDTPAKKFVTVLSYDLWQRMFGRDTTVIGRSINLNGASFLVIGVMPRGFSLGKDDELWTPLDLSPIMANASMARKYHSFYGIGRLTPTSTLATTQVDLLGIARKLEAANPEANTGHLVTVLPLQTAMAGNLRPAILLLGAAAALVLLIACANLANVTLARTIARRREMAVRAAIGAGRGRLVRQLLTESILLAVVGGAVGIGVAFSGTRALLALSPAALPPLAHVGVDTRVLLFALFTSIATGVVFGLVPALGGSRLDLHGSLKGSGRTATSGGGGLRRSLVVAQLALAVVLLVGAGLLVRSFDALQRLDAGFNPDHVLTAQLSIGGRKYATTPAMNQFYDGVLEKLRSAPGVEAAGFAAGLPLVGGSGCSMMVEIHPVPLDRLPGVRCTSVRGDYFAALRVPLVRGRTFDATDHPDGELVVVINESMANAFFPGDDPLGKRIRLGPDPTTPWQTVVGIVHDMRYESLDLAPKPTAFALDEQVPWGSLAVAIRTNGDPLRVAPALRAAVRDVDPALAVRSVRSMEDIIGTSLATRRFSMVLIATFAFVALALAAVGVYGVLAYSVTSRTREFGIRMALGANTHSVLSLVLRQGLGWSAIGLTLGIAGALAAGRSLRAFLFGVQATDIPTFAFVTATLLAVVLIACVVPARRATRVDPLQSMREE